MREISSQNASYSGDEKTTFDLKCCTIVRVGRITKNRIEESRLIRDRKDGINFLSLRFFLLSNLNFPSLSRFYLNSSPLCHPAQK